MATHAPMLSKEEGRVDWNMPADQIIFRLRALTPWPGLFTEIDGKRARIVQAEPIGDAEANGCGLDANATPGVVSGILKESGFAVRVGNGHLLVQRLQPEGKSEMDATAFLNGHALAVGRPLAQVNEERH